MIAAASALAAPLLVTGPAANAQVRTLRDDAGDVTGGNRHVDIRSARIGYRDDFIKVNIRGRHGDAGFTKRAVKYAYVMFRGGGVKYFVAGSPHGFRGITKFKGNHPVAVKCKKFGIKFHFNRSRITIRVHRSCVGRPKAVRGEIQVQGDRVGRTYDKLAWKDSIRRG